MPKLKNTKEDILEYMEYWIDDENWSDIQCMSIYAHLGGPHALEYMAHHLVTAGAINSEACHEKFKDLEKDIEFLTKKYEKLSVKTKDKVYDNVFDDVLFVMCQECNHVSFVHSGNEEVYPEVYRNCWSCDAEHLLIKRHKAGKK